MGRFPRNRSLGAGGKPAKPDRDKEMAELKAELASLKAKIDRMG